MEAGKRSVLFTQIESAIASLEKSTRAEVRVHLSHRFFDGDPFKRATKIFKKLGMSKTKERNAVLFYVNLKRKKFALIGDEGIHKKVGQSYWDDLAAKLKEELSSTHPDRAIARSLLHLGETLTQFFPAAQNQENPNELSNDVTQD